MASTFTLRALTLGVAFALTLTGAVVPLAIGSEDGYLDPFKGAPSVATPTVDCLDVWGSYQGCPDLTVIEDDLRQRFVTNVTFAPGHCAIEEGLIKEPGTRTLLRFPTASHNRHDASRGSDQGDLYLGRPVDHPDRFYWAPCHRHYHVHEFADYRLWTSEGYAKWRDVRDAHPLWTAERAFREYPELKEHFAAGLKQGFCLMDIRNVDSVESGGYGCSNQGIHLGWADVYGSYLDGQWIDVTDVMATRGGWYHLEVEMNPNHFFRESDYSNNARAIPVWIDGPLPPTEPVGLAGDPGPRAGEVTVRWEPPVTDGGKPLTQYRVYGAPAGGTLALLAEVPADAARSLTQGGLEAGARYDYAVSAVNALGEGNLSARVTLSPPVPPAAPRALAAHGGPGVGEATLSWRAPAADGGAPVTGYRVYRAAWPEAPGWTLLGEPVDGAFVDAEAPLASVLLYRVTAVNGAGEGAASGTSCTMSNPTTHAHAQGTPCGVAHWMMRDA